MRLSVVLILFYIFLSCSDNKPRYPLNKKTDFFLRSSANRNKTLIAREEFLIKKAAKLDSLYNYNVSEAGFLYAYIKTNSESSLPKKGTQVRFKYQIEDLEKNIIYSYKELGLVNYIVDQESLLPALREGIRIMRAGEVVVFLFPSYLCYSYQGDGDKVGTNQPLRFTIERITAIN